MNQLINDYLWTVEQDAGIDNAQLYKVCLAAERLLKSKFTAPKIGNYGTFTTAIFREYNFFTFANQDVLKLYHNLVKHITPILNKDTQYVMQSWVNVFRKGEFIDWHKHWIGDTDSYHGFYCVNVGNSVTTYRIEDKEYNVNGKDGLIVIGRSKNDEHRSSEWLEETPRITIAYDLVPVESLKEQFMINHYIPFK